MAKNFLDKFAEGALTGYTTGSKAQQQRELHEMQVQKYRDEKEMADAFKNLDTGAKPQEITTLTRPDGKVVAYENRSMAEEAAAALGEGARVGQRFTVGDKQFPDKESAQAAAQALTSPAAVARQRAEIAMKYNRPDLADQYTKAYRNILDSNRRDMQEQFFQAREVGDVDSVLNSVNARLKPSGAQAALVPGADGSLVYQVSKGDQVVSSTPFKSPAEFWDQMGLLVSSSPDNALETWKARQGMVLQERAVVTGEKAQAAGERASDAGIINEGERTKIARDAQRSQAQIGMANVGLAGGQLAVAQGGLTLAQQRHKLDVAQTYKPMPFSGLDPATGQTSVYGVAPTPEGGLRVLPGQVTGVNPMKPPDPFAALMKPQPAAGPAVNPLLAGGSPEQQARFQALTAPQPRPGIISPEQAAAAARARQPSGSGLYVPPVRTREQQLYDQQIPR